MGLGHGSGRCGVREGGRSRQRGRRGRTRATGGGRAAWLQVPRGCVRGRLGSSMRGWVTAASRSGVVLVGLGFFSPSDGHSDFEKTSLL